MAIDLDVDLRIRDPVRLHPSFERRKLDSIDAERTVGAGGEYAFTDYLTGFVEGDYYDFGTRTSTFNTFPVALGIPIDIKERKFVAKAGLNWKFNWFAPAPVVTRY